MSSMVVNPNALAANAASNLTITIKDAYGNVIPNQPVSLVATGTSNTLLPSSGNTNASGVLVGTLTSTKAEIKTVTKSLLSDEDASVKLAIKVGVGACAVSGTTFAIVGAGLGPITAAGAGIAGCLWFGASAAQSVLTARESSDSRNRTAAEGLSGRLVSYQGSFEDISEVLKRHLPK